jgi:putative flippase GtrA
VKTERKRAMIKKIYRKYEDIILYIIFGVLTTAVSFVTQFLASRFLGTSVIASTSISWICAVTFAYVTNRKFVFRSEEHSKSGIAAEAARFYGARIATYFMEVAIMYLCADRFSGTFIKLMNLGSLDYSKTPFSAFGDARGLNEMIFKLIANVIILISNYVLSKLLVFKKKS